MFIELIFFIVIEQILKYVKNSVRNNTIIFPQIVFHQFK